MAACTFFGHRDAPEYLDRQLKTVLIDLIRNQGVDVYYVGNNGRFDACAIRVLKDLETSFPIRFYIVLSSLPSEKGLNELDEHTILPEGLEAVPPRFRIDRRNHWMLDRSDFAVTYVRYPTGGAAKFKALAEQKRKRVVEV